MPYLEVAPSSARSAKWRCRGGAEAAVADAKRAGDDCEGL